MIIKTAKYSTFAIIVFHQLFCLLTDAKHEYAPGNTLSFPFHSAFKLSYEENPTASCLQSTKQSTKVKPP